MQYSEMYLHNGQNVALLKVKKAVITIKRLISVSSQQKYRAREKRPCIIHDNDFFLQVEKIIMALFL